jgi:hypothetical protein
MSRSSKECERRERGAGNQAIESLTLPMGEPNRCFYNATRAVWAHPDRLVYVEGFYINEYHLTHHAWVLDKLTGTRHELSFQHHDSHYDVYIGKEFTQDEMIDRTDELLDGPENWMNLLTLQEQFELLTQAGYDVELIEYRCVEETEWLAEYADIIDLRSIDMTSSCVPDNDGWDCEWRRL